jgi:hypothetical protein
MNSDPSFKFGCKESVSDTYSQFLKKENAKYTPNTAVRVVCTYIAVCLRCDTNDACKIFGGCGYPICNYSCTAVLTVL